MSKLFESGEMYLEHILLLREKKENVRAIDIVNDTGYSKPSISRALSLLKEDGMIFVDANGYITLSQKGEETAQKIYRRHRILSDFLESIGVDAETADADACRIEHFVSDQTVAKIEQHASALKKK